MSTISEVSQSFSSLKIPPIPSIPPGLAAIKTRQQATWAAGDYAVIGSRLQIVGEALCEAVDLQAGQRVLDVAAGNGNAALAAARRFARVTAIDYVPALLERARERAAADQLTIECREGDAESLPFDAGSFDVILSVFGVMFTPDQERAASELARVCRPGGTIGLANWTPDGFVGQLFKTVGRHVPPPAGLASPAAWGSKARLEELFATTAAAISVTPRHYTFRYESRAHWLEVFRTYYGPVHKAFAAVDEAGRAALAADIDALLARFDRGTRGALAIDGEYVEVVIERVGR